MFNFLKNPFERLSIANQEEIIVKLDNIYNVLNYGPIYNKLDSIDKKLDNIVSGLNNIIKFQNQYKKANKSGGLFGNLFNRGVTVKFDEKALKALTSNTSVLTESISLLVEALIAFAKNVKDNDIERLTKAIDKIVEGLVNADKKIRDLGKSIFSLFTNISKSILLFGLTLAIATPLFIVALPGAIIISFVILSFVKLFSDILGNDKNVEKLYKGSQSLYFIGTAIILFGVGMLLVGVGVYMDLINVTSLFIFGVIMGFALLFSILASNNIKRSIKEGVQGLALIAWNIILFGIALIFASKIYEYIDPLNAAGSLALILLTILGMVFVFKGLVKMQGDIIKGAQVVALMALSIIAFSFAIFVADVVLSSAKSPFFNMLLLIGAIYLLREVLKGAGKEWGNILKGTLAMTLAPLSIVAISIAYTFWNAANISLVDILLLNLAMGLLALVTYYAGKNWGEILKGTLAMTLAPIAIGTISLGYIYWKAANVKLEDILLLNLAMALLGLVTFAAGKFWGEILLGTLALTVASVAIISIAYGYEKWKEVNITLEDIGVLSAAVITIGVIMGIAGNPKLVGFILAGSAAMIVAGVAIISISYAFKIWAEAKVTLEDVGVISAAITAIAAIMGTLSFASIFIAAGAGAAIVAGAALIALASGFAKFKEIDLSEDDISKIETAIVNTLKAFSILSDKKRQKELGIDFESDSFRKGISALTGIGNVMTDIAKGIESFANMKFFTYEVVKDPKTGISRIQPKDVIELSSDKIEAAATNFGTVVSAILNPIAAVGKAEEESSGWFSGGYVSKGIEVLAGIGNIMTEVAKGVQFFANMQFIEYEIVKNPKTGKMEIQPKNIIPISKTQIEDVKTNFDIIVSGLVEPIKNFGMQSEKGEGLFSGGYIKKGVEALAGIGNFMAQMADVVIKMAGAQFPQNTLQSNNKSGIPEIKKDGEPIKLSPGDITKVSGMFKAIINGLVDPIIDAGKKIDENEDAFDKFTDNQEKLFSVLSNIGNFIEKWSKVQNPDILTNSFKTFMTNITSAFDSKNLTMNQIVNMNIFTKNLNTIAQSASSFESIANSFDKISVSMKTFKDNLNSIDKKLLAETRGLFEAMAVISEARGGDQFLKKYSQSLKKTFEELTNLLKEFKGSIDKQTEVQQKMHIELQRGNSIITNDSVKFKNNQSTNNINSQLNISQLSDDLNNIIHAIYHLETTLTTTGIKIRDYNFPGSR